MGLLAFQLLRPPQKCPTSVPPLAQTSNPTSSFINSHIPPSNTHIASPNILTTTKKTPFLSPVFPSQRERKHQELCVVPPLMRGVGTSSTIKTIHHRQHRRRYQIHDGEPLCTTSLRFVSSVSGISLRHCPSFDSHFQPQRHLLLLLPLGQDSIPTSLFQRWSRGRPLWWITIQAQIQPHGT